jgi:hypothetical protein
MVTLSKNLKLSLFKFSFIRAGIADMSYFSTGYHQFHAHWHGARPIANDLNARSLASGRIQLNLSIVSAAEARCIS